MFELCEAFYALRPTADGGPGTRLRLRTEVLAGTWEALVAGQADLAHRRRRSSRAPPPGVADAAAGRPATSSSRSRRTIRWPPPTEPISDAELLRHRAVAVADSAQRMAPLTVNLLPGQDVLTVPTMQAKLEAQLRGLGCGFLPEPMAREHLARRPPGASSRCSARAHRARLGYAWRDGAARRAGASRSSAWRCSWWLAQLDSPTTRQALLERHSRLPLAVD